MRRLTLAEAAREFVLRALDINHHAEIDAIVAELAQAGREVPRDLVVEIVRLVRAKLKAEGA